MDNKNNKCVFEEIKIENRIKPDHKNIAKKQKKIIDKKKADSKLNLIMSIILFLIMFIIAIIVISHKGIFGSYSLIPINNLIHTAELECDSYFLSTLDEETVGVTLTVDGVEVTDGFVLRSSDEEIAKIDGNKIIAGKKEGTATITAYYEVYNMTIATDILTYIPINTITASLGSNTIAKGKETKISISILPQDGTDEYISYISSDENVAAVNEDGIITGISSGKAEITIKDELTGAMATKEITVK